MKALNTSSLLLASILSCLVLASSVCSAATDAVIPPQSLEILIKSGPVTGLTAIDIPEIRFKAIREGGVAHGARAGLARRTLEIRDQLETKSENLDVIYSFQPLLIEGNVVPPVLTETRDVYDQKNDSIIRVIDAIYRIDQQPRFVFSPPTWRTYLIRDYVYQIGGIGVAPNGDIELKAWEKAVSEGWVEGRKQADRIFEEDLSRLKRDFEGIILYRSMLAKGMVTKPYISSAPLGVTGGRGVMNVNETVLRIMAEPEFTYDGKKWRTPAQNPIMADSQPDAEGQKHGVRRQIVFRGDQSAPVTKAGGR